MHTAECGCTCTVYMHTRVHVRATGVCVCVGVFVSVCERMCTGTCKQLPSNQSFNKQISSHQEGAGVSRWGEWVRKATAYKFDTCTYM